jgi:myo-inositol 2-dehydrogenase / D-chiro-inositol 1-dehydrogenase
MENEIKSNGRRQFLKGAASVAALGALGAGALLKSCSESRPRGSDVDFLDQAPEGRVLKAGLIGCGGRGTGAAMNYLDAGPNLEITALADVFQDRLDRCRRELKERKDVEVADENCFVGFDAYQQLLETGVDVVLLCAPPYFRPAHFEAAVRARKHIFMEKPVAVDPVGARSVMASARMADAAGLKIVAGTQRHHQRDYVTTYQHIKAGMIGDIVAANCYWNQSQLWYVTPRPEWTEMEAMLRDWVNWTWLAGDHIVEQHMHNIDVVNWFTGKHPVKAVGFGARYRRRTGDQYDFFSVDFEFEDGMHLHSMCRQIDGCANKVSERIVGTKGVSNCQNRVEDLDGNPLWEYAYPLNEAGQPTFQVAVSPYDQEIINLVAAIRNNTAINEAEACAISTMVAVMGRISAYTGKEVTWEEMMNSSMRLGPAELAMGPVNIPKDVPVPGTGPA